MFKFTESNKVWKTTGTVEGNKVNVTFDTSLITQNETVVCYLYFDEEQRTSDTFRFKFKVKVSEIDKLDTYAVKERYFNNSIIVDKVDVVTKKELEEALKGLTVSSVEGVLTETRADELYAKKSEIYDDTALRQRVATLEERPTTAYDDSEIKEKLQYLEALLNYRPAPRIIEDNEIVRRLDRLEQKEDKDTPDDYNNLKRDLSDTTDEVNHLVSKVSDLRSKVEESGKTILNQQDNQALKYWCGTEEEYNAIENKDDNTIYDIFE